MHYDARLLFAADLCQIRLDFVNLATVSAPATGTATVTDVGVCSTSAPANSDAVTFSTPSGSGGLFNAVVRFQGIGVRFQGIGVRFRNSGL